VVAYHVLHPLGFDTHTHAQIKGIFGGGLGIILAVNGYIGRSVHVPDLPEATNRIVVDYSEGILRQQDFGFIAVLNDENTYDNDEEMKKLHRIYRTTNGVVATVDAQWRNSPNCPKGTKKIANLPPHLHIKNMEVHYKQRSKGIAKALLEAIVDHAKQNTDAQLLTLCVQHIFAFSNACVTVTHSLSHSLFFDFSFHRLEK
jgi:GNAT superfamily N-acetyltransferase